MPIWNACSDLSLEPKPRLRSRPWGQCCERIRRAQGGIKGLRSGSNEMVQAVCITGLAPANTLGWPVMAYGNGTELEFVHCDPCTLVMVKPASERESRTGAVVGDT